MNSTKTHRPLPARYRAKGGWLTARDRKLMADQEFWRAHCARIAKHTARVQADLARLGKAGVDRGCGAYTRRRRCLVCRRLFEAGNGARRCRACRKGG